MEGWLLDSSHHTKAIIDAFESFIWTDRYCGYGDFELYLPITSELKTVISIGDYIEIPQSDSCMIVEELETTTDAETGSFLLVTGRSLESILERRIVWGQRTFQNTSFQTAIYQLLNENVMSPSISARAIPNFTFATSSDPFITALTLDTQLVGDNLYDVIFVFCEEHNLGFRIIPNVENSGFIFELYRGTDRSFAQEQRPYVIFSPDFENLLTSTYFQTETSVRTAALVAGEGEGSQQVVVEAIRTAASGLNRRELYLDASNISSKITVDDEEYELTPEEYRELLRLKGLEELTGYTASSFFEGEIDATQQFVYGSDFFIGDIVQIRNEYGMEARSRITELIRTHDVNGETFIPTFTTI